MKAFGIILIYLAIASCTDYCKLCQRHVACNNDGSFAPACRNNAVIVNLKAIGGKAAMLDQLNLLRSTVALGELKGFQPAVRMPTTQWDDELEKMAELNVKSCVFAHDKCRRTEKFKFAGQNLHYFMNSIGTPFSRIKLSRDVMKAWYSEYKDCDKSLITKFHRTPNFLSIGHFTAMMSQKNIRVGCSMIKIRNNSTFTYTTACDFSGNNMLGSPIYEEGPTGSGCKTGMNPDYPGLCSIKEEEFINANFE